MSKNEIHTSEARPTLHEAVASRDWRLVKSLLDDGADPNLPDDDGNGPLHGLSLRSGASTRPNIRRIVSLMVGAGADLDRPGKDGRSALLSCAAKGEVKSSEALLGAGADPLVMDDQGFCALHFGVGNIEELSEKAAQLQAVNSEIPQLINKLHNLIHPGMWRATLPRAGLIVELPTKTAGQSERLEDGSSVMHAAVKTGELEIVKAAIRAGYRLDLCDRSGRLPYEYAAEILKNDKAPLVALVVGRTPKAAMARVHTGTNGGRALFMALHKPDIMTVLIRGGCNPNGNVESYGSLACAMAQQVLGLRTIDGGRSLANQFKILIGAGMDVEKAVNESGQTRSVLHMVSDYVTRWQPETPGRIALIEALTAIGCKATGGPADPETPEHVCGMGGNFGSRLAIQRAMKQQPAAITPTPPTPLSPEELDNESIPYKHKRRKSEFGPRLMNGARY